MRVTWNELSWPAHRYTAEPLKTIGGFDLSFDSSSSGEIKPEIADYANKHIRNDITNQTLLGILAKNPIS